MQEDGPWPPRPIVRKMGARPQGWLNDEWCIKVSCLQVWQAIVRDCAELRQKARLPAHNVVIFLACGKNAYHRFTRTLILRRWCRDEE